MSLDGVLILFKPVSFLAGVQFELRQNSSSALLGSKVAEFARLVSSAPVIGQMVDLGGGFELGRHGVSEQRASLADGTGKLGFGRGLGGGGSSSDSVGWGLRHDDTFVIWSRWLSDAYSSQTSSHSSLSPEQIPSTI